MDHGLLAIDRPQAARQTGRKASDEEADGMAAPGQTLVNPASGERITFRTTSAETDGELVAIDLELPAGARVPGPLHLHPNQEERFEVIDGTMGFRLRREHVVARPGAVVVVPPGVPHDFANEGAEPALVRVEIRPALKMEQLFETAVALAERGRTMLGGIPKPLELALFTREFEQEVRSALAPRWLQRLALAPLAWAARLLRRDLLRARGMAARQTGLRCFGVDR
jgi:mannose-6-phosphate isomerase-like protein (cupin superfamily)